MTRRRFLEGSLGGALALSLSHLDFAVRPASAAGEKVRSGVDYQDFQDIYREEWKWDHVAKGTHFVNCWYQRGCNWNVYVKDGIVWREEQSGTYPQVKSDVPDYNPRGCQKGACYSQRMYDDSRVRYPMKRVGERGSGKWKRVTWEEALRDIVDKTIDVLETDGPEAVVWDQGTAQTTGCAGLGLSRLSSVLDMPVFDENCEIGDHRPGTAITCGKISFCSSADDVFYSDLILIWGGNPIYTQIPQAHFLTEARYNGARVVCIAPDYSASSVHADDWVPVKVASDAALGLSMAQVMIEEKIYNAQFVREQTDLPLLVREDTGHFLRESDLERGGDEDTFYVFDEQRGEIIEAPKRTLAWGDRVPALEGHFAAKGVEGPIRVTPVFARLREHLQNYTPEKAQATTGTHPETVRELARALANAKAATCITQSNFSKFYHGIEMERAQILVFALAGQMGHKGAGFIGFPYLHIDSVDMLGGASGSMAPHWAVRAMSLKAAPAFIKGTLGGLTREMVIYELAREEHKKRKFPSSILWLYKYGGLKEFYGGSQQWDPHMKRPLDQYLAEAEEKGWQTLPQTPPRILFEDGGNMLRRIRGYQKLLDELFPKLDLVVTIDWRMSNTALHSDYVLPAAGWYEKDDITWATPLSPFSQVITKAVEPWAESKSDWEIHCLFMKTLQQRAVERGVLTYNGIDGEEKRLDDVYDQYTFGRRYTENNTEEFLDEILRLSSNVGGARWSDVKEKGFARFTDIGNGYLSHENAMDVDLDDTMTACTWHTEKKQPWPTLTRRIQFCIDHPFYNELGETLPVHKDDPNISGDYPLKLTGGHTRWSIHASWRDEKNMLRLTRGEPVAFISVEDADARGIGDGDRIRVFNDIASTELVAKVTPAHSPGMVTIYHAWEPFQFKGRTSHAALTPNPINPVQLAGGYVHLQPRGAVCSPGSTDRATRIEMERVA
ncbi:MAG: molybdopterin-dependent oxidoreductase [Myxococcota bacterium]|nr:molybdopterin-dependent oxidoreductase [Myxococcota bacterium]